jgi:predicted dehydrogenase
MTPLLANPPSIGLVGCGLWGRNILRDLQALGAPVDVVEPDPSSRDRAREAGARTTCEGLEALPEVDGLVVATPATTHARVIERLLERGVPIYAEKPFTTDVESATRMVERAGDRIFVMDVWRYHPGVERLAAIARTGDLGPVHGLRTVRTHWTSPRRDIDPVWTLAPHDLSISLEILGEIPTPRFAFAERVAGRVAGLYGLLGERPWLSLEVSTRYADKRREIRLHCEEGVAVLPSLESSHLEVARGGPESPEPALETWDLPADGTPLERELAAFLGYLAGGPAPRSSAAEGLAVVQAMVDLRRLAGLADAAPAPAR